MNKIEALIVRKKSIDLILNTGESISISPDTQREFFLYTGKELSDNELKKLRAYENTSLFLNYALKVLSRASYTAYEIKLKLQKRNASDEVIKDIIKRLKEYHLLNDEDYAKERINYLITVKHASRRYIENDLKTRGINFHMIEDLLSNVSAFEKEELIKLMPKLIRARSKESLRMAKEKILSKLYSEGYESSAINEALSAFVLEDYINEDENLLKAGEKLCKKHPLTDEKSHKLVYNKLSKAGYPHHKIIEYLRERTYEN